MEIGPILQAFRDPVWAERNVGQWRTEGWIARFLRYLNRADNRTIPYSEFLDQIIAFINRYTRTLPRDFITEGALDALWECPDAKTIHQLMDHLMQGRLWGDEGIPHLRPSRFPNPSHRKLLYTHPERRTVYDAIDLATSTNNPIGNQYGLLLLHNMPDSINFRRDQSPLQYAASLPNITIPIIRLLLLQRMAPDELFSLVDPIAMIHRADARQFLMDEMARRIAENIIRILSLSSDCMIYIVEHNLYYNNGSDKIWLQRYFHAKYDQRAIPIRPHRLPEMALLFSLLRDQWSVIGTRLPNLILNAGGARYIDFAKTFLDACMQFMTPHPDAMLRLMLHTTTAPQDMRQLHTYILRRAGYTSVDEVRTAISSGVRRPERLRWLLAYNDNTTIPA